MKRAVLTGATGFVGSHFSQFLEGRGVLVRHIGRGTTREQMVDLFSTFKPDVVFHIASLFIAEHQPSDVSNLIRSNLEFPTLVLQSMADTGLRKLVNTGSSWQHFEDRDLPVNLYAATKSAFEEILKYFVSAHRFDVVTLKLFDTYGPNDVRPKLIPKLIQALGSEKVLELSPGAQKLDFVHIDDIVIAYLRAAELVISSGGDGSIKEFALSSGEILSLKELIQKISDISSQPLSVNWGARPYRQREVMQPWSLGQTLPGWKPTIGLNDGLKALINAK